MRRLLLSLCCSLAISSASALEFSPEEPPINRIVELPVDGLRAIEKEGKIFFLSTNGRFVLSGQIVDVWQRKPLDTFEQIREAALKLDVRAYGVDPDELNTITIGAGPKEVIMFTDPLCSICHSVLDEAKDLMQEYTFKLILVPALGNRSNQLIRSLFCSATTNEEKRDLYLRKDLASVNNEGNCDSKRHDQTLTFAQMMGVNGVPLIINPMGTVIRGRPPVLKAFLEGSE
ncbi:Thiol:disulfide interchange protein DsbC precursor [Pseudovibrio sp. Ad37]|nr:Thiol:disulfide interchange protein DsbC precursor [Pseudovibrio sp. Ad37]